MQIPESCSGFCERSENSLTKMIYKDGSEAQKADSRVMLWFLQALSAITDNKTRSTRKVPRLQKNADSRVLLWFLRNLRAFTYNGRLSMQGTHGCCISKK